MNYVFTTIRCAIRTKVSRLLCYSRLKLVLTMITCTIHLALTGQIATEIIRTSDNTPLVTVLESGNVGIGVAGPLHKLQVDGIVQALGLKLTTGALNNYVLTSDGSGTGTWQPTQLAGIGGSGTIGYLSRFSGATTLSNSVFYQDEDGDIGIGTEVPSRSIHIYSSSAGLKIENPTSNSNPGLYMENDTRQWQIFVDGGNTMTDGFAIRDVMAGADRLIIHTDGDIGIGVVNPDTRLSVNGDVRASSLRGRTGGKLVLSGYDNGIGGGEGIEYDAVEGGHDFQTHDGGWVSRMYVSDAGNIGIGTTNPSDKLDVIGSVRAAAFTSSSPLYLQTAGVTRIYADDVSGFVGIGTTSPASLLHVAGTTEMTGFKLVTGAVNNYVLTSDGSGNASWQPTQLAGIGGGGSVNYLPKFTASSTLGSSGIIEDGSGKIGIGTGSPLQQLSIGNGYTNSFHFETATDFPTLHFGDGYGIYINYGFGGGLGFAFNGSAGTGVWGRFLVDGSELMRLTANGDLGIGTDNPQAKLHVEGTAQMAGFKMSTDASNNYVLTSNGSGTGTWQPTQLVGIGGGGSSGYLSKFDGTTTLNSSVFFQDGDGEVGIGTEVPSRSLHIYSSTAGLKIENPTANSNPSLYIENDVRQWQLFVDGGNSGTDGFMIRDIMAGQDRFLINTSGNVGIGTSSPVSRLHVEGTAQMTGFKLTAGATNNYVLTSDGSGAGTWQPTQLVGIGGSGTINYLTKFTGSTTLGSSGMVEDGSGRIGIGTSTPLQQLSIGNGYTNSFHFETATDFPTLHFGDGYGIYINYGFGGGLGFAFNGSAGTGVWGRFLVDGSELMRLTSSGDLGIGTDNPQAKLHVEGTALMNGFKMGTGASNNYVLTSNGSGTGTWQPTQLVGIGGSGTSGYLSKFNGTTTLNSSVFYQDGDGDIGIGTEVPSRPLHIYSSIAAMQITNPTTNSNPSLFLENDQRIWQIFVDGGNSGTDGFMIRDGNAGQDRFLINTSGDVGIGTANPLSKLHVEGAVRASAFTSNSPLLLQTNGTTRIYVDDSNGNVGIGTTTPQQLLVIKGNETSNGEQLQISTGSGSRTWGIGVNSSSGGFTIRDETGLVNPISIAAGAVTGSISIGTNSVSLLTGGSGSHIRFSTNASERMRIDHSGNVGIGTITPSARMDVVGTVQMTGFTLPTGAINTYVLTSDASGNGTWQAAPGSGTSGTMNYISKFTGTNTLESSGIYEDGSGNVGIGTTSPQQLLVIKGNETASGEQFQISTGSGSRTWGIGVNSASGGLTIRDETGLVNPISIAAGAATGSISIGTNSVSLLTGGSGSHIRFSTNVTERLRIDHSGNVGIGTTSPASKLDVAGTVRATAFSSSSPLLLQTNGTTRIFVNDITGHVGIGTDSTTNILTIDFGSASDPIADAWTMYSSRRWKTNIETIDNALVNVMGLRGVSYQWKADGKKDIGFIAEEVGAIYPEIVTYEENGIDAKSVDYSRLVAVLVEAMKQQQAIIDNQQSAVHSMAARLEKLERLLTE